MIQQYTHTVVAIKDEDFEKFQKFCLENSIAFTQLDSDTKWEFQNVMDETYESSYESSYDNSGCEY